MVLEKDEEYEVDYVSPEEDVSRHTYGSFDQRLPYILDCRLSLYRTHEI